MLNSGEDDDRRPSIGYRCVLNYILGWVRVGTVLLAGVLLIDTRGAVSSLYLNVFRSGAMLTYSIPLLLIFRTDVRVTDKTKWPIFPVMAILDTFAGTVYQGLFYHIHVADAYSFFQVAQIFSVALMTRFWIKEEITCIGKVFTILALLGSIAIAVPQEPFYYESHITPINVVSECGPCVIRPENDTNCEKIMTAFTSKNLLKIKESNGSVLYSVDLYEPGKNGRMERIHIPLGSDVVKYLIDSAGTHVTAMLAGLSSAAYVVMAAHLLADVNVLVIGWWVSLFSIAGNFVFSFYLTEGIPQLPCFWTLLGFVVCSSVQNLLFIYCGQTLGPLTVTTNSSLVLVLFLACQYASFGSVLPPSFSVLDTVAIVILVGNSVGQLTYRAVYFIATSRPNQDADYVPVPKRAVLKLPRFPWKHSP